MDVQQLSRRFVRAPGFRGLNVAAPTIVEIPGYQEIARIASREEAEALSLRNPIGIGAMVAFSLGASILLSAEKPNTRAAGAALAGAGATAGAGALALHLRATNRREVKDAYVRALATIGAPAPGVIMSEGDDK